MSTHPWESSAAKVTVGRTVEHSVYSPRTNWASENIDAVTAINSFGEGVDFWCEMILRLFADMEVGAIPNSEFDGKVKTQKCELLLESVASQVGPFTPGEITKLAETATNLIALVMGNLQPVDPEHSGSRGMALMRVKVFVNDNLCDPSLNAQQVAHGIGLSVRYINKLFEQEGSSLMRYTLRRRLERCGADLLNPSNGALRITDIAFRWGFNDLSHFSRTFRGFYKLSPRDWRFAQGQIAGK